MSLVVILGMHRSGTSLLCRSLHHAGLHLGDNVMTAPNQDNLEGHWEAVEAIRINDRILALSDGSWDAPPGQIMGGEETDRDMQRFLRDLSTQFPAGWKDPRTVVTWPRWKVFLPADHRIVAAFRHPLAVARSLQTREGWSLEKGISLWSEYNRRLLAITDAARDVLWFNFDVPESQLRADLTTICGQLGLRSLASEQLSFNPFLRHNKPQVGELDANVQALFDALCARARHSNLGQVEKIDVPSAVSLEARIEQLARVVAALDVVQQRAIRNISHLVAGLAAVQDISNECKRFVDRVRGTMAYRAVRCMIRSAVWPLRAIRNLLQKPECDHEVRILPMPVPSEQQTRGKSRAA